MNLTGHSERTGKQDVRFQYIRTAFPVSVFGNSFHTYGTSEHLINTRTSFRKEHAVVNENVARRPSLLRLDSQGASWKNDRVYAPRHADNTSSGNFRTFELFSDILRSFADTHKQPLMPVRYQKPELVKPYDSSLNITSAVKLLCQKNDLPFTCGQSKASAASSDNDAAMFRIPPLHYWTKVMPSRSSDGKVIRHDHQEPVQLVSNLHWQPDEHGNNCCQELQCDFHFAVLSARCITPFVLPCVLDLTDCLSTSKLECRENFANQISLASVRSSDTADTARTLDTRWARPQSRQLKYNCRRRCLRVYHNTRYRKPSTHSGTTFSAGIDRSASDCEVLHSEIDSNECADSMRDNKFIRSDGTHAVPQYCSPVHCPVTPCDEDSLWVNTCYPQLSLLPSLYDTQQTDIQESCSFASLFFVSGKEMDSSDISSTDSDESDCSEFLSTSSACRTDDVLADALLSGLPCIRVPFIDNWLMDFSDCAAASFDSDFEVYFDEDSASVPSKDVVCKYSAGVREANAQWNEAYSFPVDVVSEGPQRRCRMVQFSSDVSVVTVLNQLEWADAYREARCGPWEQYARDRERFSRRVCEVDSQISWVLDAEHRATKYHYLQTCQLITDNSATSLFTS